MLADIYKTGGTLMIERFSERCVSVFVKGDIHPIAICIKRKETVKSVQIIFGIFRYCQLTRKIEGKAMIRNRYNYPTPPIKDIKGKETQTRNN